MSGQQSTSVHSCSDTNVQCSYTDHPPLKALLKSPHPSGKLARWAQVISELDLDIRYKPGMQNANADTLSRAPVGGEDKPEVAVGGAEEESE